MLNWRRRAQRNAQKQKSPANCPHEIRWDWNPKRLEPQENRKHTFLFYYFPYLVSPSQLLVYECFTERRPQLQPYKKRVDSKDKVEMELRVLSVKACKIFITSLPSPQGWRQFSICWGSFLICRFHANHALQLNNNNALQVNLDSSQKVHRQWCLWGIRKGDAFWLYLLGNYNRGYLSLVLPVIFLD